MKKIKSPVIATVWFEQDRWVIDVAYEQDDTHIAFGNCVARQNVAKTAITAAAGALNVAASSIKLVKVDYIGSNRG
jgi:hypothetical protein